MEVSSLVGSGHWLLEALLLQLQEPGLQHGNWEAAGRLPTSMQMCSPTPRPPTGLFRGILAKVNRDEIGRGPAQPHPEPGSPRSPAAWAPRAGPAEARTRGNTSGCHWEER